jgi:rhamnogalacturonyl hydrolase YesR
MKRSLIAIIAAVLTLMGMLTPAPARATAPSVTTTADLPRHAAVLASMKLAADYYRGSYAHTTLTPKNGWSWSTYTQGVQALYSQVGDGRFLADGLAWGKSNGWGISGEIDPDSIKAGETYFDLHAFDHTASLAAMDVRMASDLAYLPVSRYDWIDALFMGLPDWTRWAKRTGDAAYLNKLDALYTWARDRGATSERCARVTAPQAGLFDAGQALWYRDCTFVGAKDVRGLPIFWSRGNGWVVAALAQVVDSLPSGDLRGTKYATMLRTMAARLLQLQGRDGLWRASLADSALYPQPESSGTGLITYALAYGVRAGILDAPTYLPAIARAWNGLTALSLKGAGFLTNCQPQGVGPATPYTAAAPRIPPTSTSAGTLNADSPPFCVGAFLLAGEEVARLTSSPSTGRPVAYSSQQSGNEARRVDDGDVTTRWSAAGFPQAVTIDLGANFRLSNAMVVPYLGRAYRYRIETSTDRVHWQLDVDRSQNTSPGTRLDDFTPGTVNARYARLTVTGVYGASTTWASILEFAVYDRFKPRVDLARGRPTTSTTTRSGDPPAKATDGSSTTWWSAAIAPTSTRPQSLVVELGASTAIDTVRWFARAGYGPRQATVDLSTNGTTYRTVGSVSLANAEGPSAVIFPSSTARWVRLTISSSYSPATVSVEQLEVFRP